MKDVDHLIFLIFFSFSTFQILKGLIKNCQDIDQPQQKTWFPAPFFLIPSLTLELFQLMTFAGYFAVDKDSTSEKLVFNRTVTLRDNYAKGGKWSSFSEEIEVCDQDYLM